MGDKEEIILRLLESLNAGNSGYYDNRLHMAMYQYDQLVKNGIIKEERTETT